MMPQYSGDDFFQVGGGILPNNSFEPRPIKSFSAQENLFSTAFSEIIGYRQTSHSVPFTDKSLTQLV